MRDSQQAAARRRISNDSASRNAQRAERQQQHRAREQAAQHDKNTNLREAEKTQQQVERELTRKDSARRRKQRSRAVASAQAAQSTTTMDKRSRRCEYNTKRRYQYKCVARALCRASEIRLQVKLLNHRYRRMGKSTSPIYQAGMTDF